MNATVTNYGTVLLGLKLNNLNTGRVALHGFGTQLQLIAYGAEPKVHCRKFEWHYLDRDCRNKYMQTSYGRLEYLILQVFLVEVVPAGKNRIYGMVLAWTEVADLNTAKSVLSGSGDSTAALAMVDDTTAVNTESLEWNFMDRSC